MAEKEKVTIEKLASALNEKGLKRLLFAAFESNRKGVEENHKYKAAFMDLLSDYTQNGVDHVYVDSFCELCPLQKHQWGGCSKDLNTDFDYGTCAEEIFKFYVENSNE